MRYEVARLDCKFNGNYLGWHLGRWCFSGARSKCPIGLLGPKDKEIGVCFRQQAFVALSHLIYHLAYGAGICFYGVNFEFTEGSYFGLCTCTGHEN